MSFLSLLYTVFIMPLQLIFEELYFFAYKLCGNPGLSIIALSLVVNLLVLPLYNRADAMQIEERDIEKKLRRGVEHIKKTFKGDEQLMMLQTYYRQNNYSPTDIIKGSISLFLEIPFFVAAYQFLSHLEILQGVHLGPIKDLGAPDGLLTVAGISINIMPILMTLINVVAAYIFTKDFPLKTKIQLQGMALFFLVFLYSSPAGLVFYWTLNNLFNLIKTIIYKLKNPVRGAQIALFLCSLVILIYGFFFLDHPTNKKKVFSLICAVALNLPLILAQLKQYRKEHTTDLVINNNRKIFLCGGVFLSILLGAVIPSAVITASPQEFVILGYFSQPTWYIASAFALAFGMFIIWFGVFYWLAPQKYKAKFDFCIWLICGIAITNYMFFGRHLGILTASLQYEKGLLFTSHQKWINTLVLLVVLAVLIFIWRKWKKYISDILLITSVAMLCMVTVNVIGIQKYINKLTIEENNIGQDNKLFSLSKNGKNVIVLMLDRGIGLYTPFILEEKPLLKKQFAGFKYYANTVSFGPFTNFGTPSLFGGYEYTPEEINKRDKELLKDKQNEALKVMPVLFDRNNYDVTVCDLPYANYQWIPDLSIFKEYPKIKTYNTMGKYDDNLDKENAVTTNKRNFYCFAQVKCLPVFLQKYFYDNGNYNLIKKEQGNQEITSLVTAMGINKHFMRSYNVLTKLSSLTGIKENGNTALIMANDITHEPALLQLPEYVPSKKVDNTEYEKEHSGRFIVGNLRLEMNSTNQMIHYQANMAAMLQLGRWFDYLRSNGVYDNTRIIIVADHGRGVNHNKKFIFNKEDDIERFYPLFMVKDFNSHELTVSEEFMTNADVPTIAMNGLINHPVNPFTGKMISSKVKKEGKLYIFSSSLWDVNKNNGNTFKPGTWYSVEKDMRDKANWKLVKENATLPY